MTEQTFYGASSLSKEQSEQLNRLAAEAARNGMPDELRGYIAAGATLTPEQVEEFKVTSAKPSLHNVQNAREISRIVHQYEKFDTIAKLIAAEIEHQTCQTKNGKTDKLSRKAQENLGSVTYQIRTSLIKSYSLEGVEQMHRDFGIEKGDYARSGDRQTTRQMAKLGQDIAESIEVKNARYRNNPLYHLLFHAKDSQVSFELTGKTMAMVSTTFSSQESICSAVAEEKLAPKPQRSRYIPQKYNLADGIRGAQAREALIQAEVDRLRSEGRRQDAQSPATNRGLLEIPELSSPTSSVETQASLKKPVYQPYKPKAPSDGRELL